MEIELNLVLNWTGSKLFGKVLRIKKKTCLIGVSAGMFKSWYPPNTGPKSKLGFTQLKSRNVAQIAQFTSH
jgi:hypothetical protein